jgi:Flp pilus assembly protein TadB
MPAFLNEAAPRRLTSATARQSERSRHGTASMESTRQETMITFGVALAVLYVVFWVWHSPWVGNLTRAGIDRCLAIIETRLLPAEEVKALGRG